MKKKIFLMLSLICVISCLFVLSISANTIISEQNIDGSDNIAADYLGDYAIDGQSQGVASIDISYTSVNGETKEGKIYFATNFWGARRQIHSTYLPSDFDMNQTVYMIDYVDVDNDGVADESEKIKGLQGSKTLYYKYGTYADGTFTDLTDVKKQIVKLNYSRYIEYIGGNAYAQAPLVTVTYNGKEAVEGTFFVAPSISEIHNGAFGGSANGNINGDTGMFTRLVFEARNHNLSLGQYAFCRNVIEEVVFLGTGSYGLRGDGIAFLWYDGTNTPCLKRVVVQDGVKFSGEISWNVGNYDIVFIGEKENYSYDNYSTCLKNATGKVTYEDICYVYGHTIEDDNDCTTALTCSECGEIFENAYEAHDVQAIIEYNNGFGSVGYKGVSCQRCAYKETTEVSPLFTVLGFSAAQYGDAIYSVNYRVNEDAILAYEEITGETVNYGVFAVKAEAIGTNDIFDENGVARTGVVAADITGAGFGLVNLKIMGFNEEQKKTPLAMGAFVKTTKEGTVKYSYLQIDEPTNGKYYLASYNDVLLITPKDKEESAQ